MTFSAAVWANFVKIGGGARVRAEVGSSMLSDLPIVNGSAVTSALPPQDVTRECGD